MSWLRPGDGRERREQTGKDRLDAYCDRQDNPNTYQPSDGGVERHMDEPRRLQIPPETRPRYSVHGQQNLPFGPPHPLTAWQERIRLPLERGSSPGRQEERRPPPQRRSSPGRQDVNREDSDTLARWRNAQPTRKETRDKNQVQATGKGVKVHFSRPTERRLVTPEEDDDDEEEEESSSSSSSSSSASSLGGSVAIVGKGERKSDYRNHALSYSFDLLEHEGAGSGDEDGFVHVSRRLRRGSSRGSPHDRRG